ncbi:MAG TPA: S9 family peptidase [Burkholderiales bacterium]|nr:S9 family peptidase [Burkholderiales bacterium]
MTYTVDQHIALGRVSEIAASPDGKWLAVSVQRLDRERAKYVSDLWKVPTDGSPAVQLTRGESKDTAPCFRHDGALGFLSNRQPNEVKPDEEAEKRMQVWLLPAEGGEPRQLTDEPLGVEAFRFAKRADRMCLFAPVIAGVEHDKQREKASQRAKHGPSARRFTMQPVRHWDHWLHENLDLPCTHLIEYAPGGRRVDLTPDARLEFAIEPELDISEDGRRVAALSRRPGADRELDVVVLLIDLETRAARELGVADCVYYEGLVFSPDGRTVATTRSKRDPKVAVRPLLTLFDTAGGAARTIGERWDRWPLLGAWSADGKRLIVTADDEGLKPVFSISVDAGAVERLSARSAGGAHDQPTLLADGRIAVVRSTLLDAPECWVVAPKRESVPQPLARLSGFTDAGGWAEVESFTTPSTDGTPIQSFLVRPKGRKERLPLAFWIHGGPIGMDTDGWHWRWNPLLLVAQGHAVALPNPRGSTGFGQDFIQGIWGNVWGAQCYQDLMAVADALEARPDIDPQRTMAMGGSFGGYMTNWIGTQTDRFKCLITHASVFTMANFTGVTDHPAWWYLEMGGEDPYADPERFDRYAPVRHVQKWKSPALIIHGEKDYRCPISEGLNLFEALQYHRVPSELLVFPDENHWILKPRNVAVWYEAVLGFIAKHLGASRARRPATARPAPRGTRRTEKASRRVRA